jgi:spore coat protein CotF
MTRTITPDDVRRDLLRGPAETAERYAVAALETCAPEMRSVLEDVRAEALRRMRAERRAGR